MIALKAAAISLCAARNSASVSAVFFRHFVEFHDQILDHCRLDAGMAEKAEAIVAQLKKYRLIAGAHRQHPGIARQNRTIAHIDRGRKNFRQMAIERVGDDAPGLVKGEAQRPPPLHRRQLRR